MLLLRLAQSILFALESFKYLEDELKDLRTQATQCGIAMPVWLRSEATTIESPEKDYHQKCDVLQLKEWEVRSKNIIERANEMLKQRPSTARERVQYLWKGTAKELEKVKIEFRELQESIMVVLLVINAGIPMLKGRIAEELRTKQSFSQTSGDPSQPRQESIRVRRDAK